jgi:hypothetical protein
VSVGSQLIESLTMISKPIHDIRFADLNALIGNVAEGKTIEYKREMPAGTRDEKIKFLAAVSSLANSAGGDLLIGVQAKDGIPVAIPGVAFTNLDDEKLRLESLLADCIEPRIPRIEIEPVAGVAATHAGHSRASQLVGTPPSNVERQVLWT